MVIELAHDTFIKNRRAFILHQKLCDFFPDFEVSVLDVGCGDGSVASHLSKSKMNLKITGIDPLVRKDTAIPVAKFDGAAIPFASDAFDFCLFVDVLHHAADPFSLLKESVRVARRGVIIKDHIVQGILARQTLKFMDDTHNRRYGVSLPYNYWTPVEWEMAFRKLGLKASKYDSRLKLYPSWADWIFGRKLHFLGLFEKFGS